MNPSIRRRLLVILLPTVVIAWLASAASSYFDSMHEQGEVFDAQLAQAAKVLMLLAIHEAEESALSASKEALKEDLNTPRARQVTHQYENRLVFQVWAPPGKELALRSEQAPLTPLSELPYGFSDARIDGKYWRVFTLSDDEYNLRVSVADDYAGRRQLARTIAIRVLVPLFVIVPILALVLWFSVGRALMPLNRLAREVKNRKPTHLDPLREDDAPDEIMPMVDALNALFVRLQSTLENERRFTADAAHELRTPLAGIKTQAQVALREENNQKRSQSLHLLISAVDRTSHLVEQLLTLARLDPETGVTDPVPLHLGRLVSEVAADLAALALEKHIELSVVDHCGKEVIANKEAVKVLVRNLLDNALRYTPRNGTVEAVVEVRDGDAVLTVADSGPGIPEEERVLVLERFSRSTRSSGIGSGLGLSIVRRIAQLHHATLNLERSHLGGLQIEVRFPLDGFQGQAAHADRRGSRVQGRSG